MGKNGIMQALSMVPGLSDRLAPRRAEYETWLDAFLACGEPEPEEPAGGEPAAAGDAS